MLWESGLCTPRRGFCSIPHYSHFVNVHVAFAKQASSHPRNKPVSRECWRLWIRSTRPASRSLDNLPPQGFGARTWELLFDNGNPRSILRVPRSPTRVPLDVSAALEPHAAATRGTLAALLSSLPWPPHCAFGRMRPPGRGGGCLTAGFHPLHP
ncbi:hypothetical protein PYCCODRAFT_1126229 [Trametes coccinea BRFM310]|uniref:Uncharacterized protein n=1 Tax=Trametes coccinea (strain BRFM310) TaxID=1353009 RepID=A0A1Y2I8Y1_TRAC3|nr:hypothetical protein PYCCODRAFT_1126229 [Trametes coccinea BRFM310]